MAKIFLLAVGFVFSFTQSIYSLEKEIVFQFDDNSLNNALSAFPKNSYYKADYGLSEQQISEIFNLSHGTVNFKNIYHVKLPKNVFSLDLHSHPIAGVIEPNIPPPSIIGDPQFDTEWWVEKLNVKEAWKEATGKGVTIADCDAGFYSYESDINPNLLLEHRYDLADKDDPFNIVNGGYVYHGTAVTAIMSGVLDGKGTNGIAYNSKVIPLQNYNYDETIDDLNKEIATARCILRALTVQKVNIIVLENQTANGSSETYVGTREAVKLAMMAGVTIVSAAGNYRQELKIEEQFNTGSIIVGALLKSGDKASWSNYGNRITVAAFGEYLKTLYGPYGEFGSFGGTSGATPQVAAAIAMMIEVNPKLTPIQIQEILIKTRIQNDEIKQVGGMLNIRDAIKYAKEISVDINGYNLHEEIHHKVLSILSK